jgi:hypothetical protein
MPPGRALALIAALALAGACSRHDPSNVGDDLKDAGHNVGSAAAKVAHDPDIKAAEADLKAAGHDIARDVRKAGAQAKIAAHDVASDTHHAAHDVTHNDDGDSSN